MRLPTCSPITVDHPPFGVKLLEIHYPATYSARWKLRRAQNHCLRHGTLQRRFREPFVKLLEWIGFKVGTSQCADLELSCLLWLRLCRIRRSFARSNCERSRLDCDHYAKISE